MNYQGKDVTLKSVIHSVIHARYVAMYAPTGTVLLYTRKYIQVCRDIIEIFLQNI